VCASRPAYVVACPSPPDETRAHPDPTPTVASGKLLWRQSCAGDAQAVLATDDWVFTGFHQGCNKQPTGKLDANSVAHGGARDNAFLPYLHPFLGVKSLAATPAALVAAGAITDAAGVQVGGFAIFPKKR